MFKTEKQARKYAENLKEFDKQHVVFKVPEWTRAYAEGMRYATCLESERPGYEQQGAKFLDEPTAPTTP